MTTIFILFYISLAAMIAMVGIKVYETSSGSMFFTTKLGRSIDHVFEGWYAVVRTWWSYVSWYNVQILFWWIVRVVFRFLHISYRYVEKKATNHPRSRKIIDMVKGKGVVPQRSSGASLYLKRIKPGKIV
jgi:hypothetical protein